MLKTVRRAIIVLAAMPALTFGAESYPTQPIKLVLGYAAGGSADVVARLFGQRLSDELGETVVVENRGGASGTIGAQAVINAKPDGYTLHFVASPTVTLTPAVQKVSFDPLKDFTPIAPIVDYVSVLTVDEESNFKSLDDIIDAAKKNPGSITFGSSGVGSASHLAGEMLAEKAGVTFTHVPYKGNAPAITDLMAGRISFVFDLTTTAQANVNSGKLRALAVTSAERNPIFPEVPTMVESGFEDFAYSAWFGLLGPANMPDSIVQKISDTTEKIVRDPEFSERMKKSGYLLSYSTPKELGQRIQRESEMFTSLVNRLNIRQE